MTLPSSCFVESRVLVNIDLLLFIDKLQRKYKTFFTYITDGNFNPGKVSATHPTTLTEKIRVLEILEPYLLVLFLVLFLLLNETTIDNLKHFVTVSVIL